MHLGSSHSAEDIYTDIKEWQKDCMSVKPTEQKAHELNMSMLAIGGIHKTDKNNRHGADAESVIPIFYKTNSCPTGHARLESRLSRRTD